MADDDQEKTEEASQTRREDFRKRGQVAHSRELASALFLLAGAMGIVVLSKMFFSQIYSMFQYSFGVDASRGCERGDP